MVTISTKVVEFNNLVSSRWLTVTVDFFITVLVYPVSIKPHIVNDYENSAGSFLLLYWN